MNRLDTMALPATLRSPGRATALVLAILVIAAAVSGLAYKFLLGDLSDLWALLVTGLLVVTVGGSLLTQFVTWPLASRRVELFDQTQTTESALHHDEQHRSQFAALDHKLANATSEVHVVEILAAELGSLGVADLVELHIINEFDDTLDFVAANRAVVQPHAPTSPWDCKSAVAGSTITTNSTANADSCAHLGSRVGAPVSAVSVPLLAQGGILGVLHATGPEGDPPTPTAVFILEAFASRAALNIALQRSSTEAWRSHIDPVTSLPHVDDVTIGVGRAVAANQPQAVAWLGIDNLDQLDPEFALTYKRWVASLLVSVFPAGSTIGARSDGDQLVAVDLDANMDFAGVVDRLEYVRTAVAQRQTDDSPGTTISVGVVPSTGATSTIEVVAKARAAFDHARKSGGNKVIKPAH